MHLWGTAHGSMFKSELQWIAKETWAYLESQVTSQVRGYEHYPSVLAAHRRSVLLNFAVVLQIPFLPSWFADIIANFGLVSARVLTCSILDARLPRPLLPTGRSTGPSDQA
jgi:hypothetical protein